MNESGSDSNAKNGTESTSHPEQHKDIAHLRCDLREERKFFALLIALPTGLILAGFCWLGYWLFELESGVTHSWPCGLQVVVWIAYLLVAAPLLAVFGFALDIVRQCDIYLKNLKEGEGNDAVLESLIRQGEPFGLYFRSFTAESDLTQNIVHPGPYGASIYPADFRKRARFEERTLKRITSHIRVFSFLNYRDINRSQFVTPLNLIGAESWKTHFIRYAERAKLIVVDIESHGPGIDFEVDWLSQHSDPRCVLLLATTTVLQDLRRDHAQFVQMVRWLVPRQPNSEPENIHLPADLFDYLSGLSPESR